MFEKFFGKIKKFLKKGDFEKKKSSGCNSANCSSSEQSDETLGNVSGGQGNMPSSSHGPK